MNKPERNDRDDDKQVRTLDMVIVYDAQPHAKSIQDSDNVNKIDLLSPLNSVGYSTEQPYHGVT